jgi:4-amino-4-deoxy-L-arabinose transferase-like glycosyltransferase
MTTSGEITPAAAPPASIFLPGALLVLLCALGLRLVVLLQFRELNPLFDHPVIDAWHYDNLAREFLRLGRWPEPGAFFQPPAYPFFLAAVYAVFGESYTWARLIQAVLGSCSCAFVYALGCHLHSRRTGLIAGLITAGYGPLIFFDLDLLAPVFIIFWSTLGLWLLLIGVRREKPLILLAAGLCLGAAVACWPIIGLACGLILLLAGWLARRSPAKALRQVLLLLLGIILPILPSFLYNISHGQWVLVSTNGGINFYIGNNPRWQESVALRPGYPWETIVNLPLRLYGPEQVEQTGNSALFTRESLRFIRSQPGQYLRNQLVKLYQIGYGYEIMRNTDLYFFKQYSPVLDALLFSRPWLKFPFGLLLPFAGIGIFLSLPRLAREHRYLLAYLAAVAAGLLLFFVTARYRVVMVPVLAVYAALGAGEMVTLLRKRSARVLPLFLAAVLLGLFFNLDLFNQEQRVTGPIYRAQAPFTLGRVALEQGRPREALAWMEESLRIDPAYPDAWVDLGRAKHALGDSPGAILAMRQAAAVAPDYPLPYYNLGLLYDRPGIPPAQAIAWYRQFLARAEAYFDDRIRGTERNSQVRQRLAMLQAQERQP